MTIAAFTNCFCAFALSPGSWSPVVRVSWTPLTVTVVVAWITTVPVTPEVIVSVQLPVVPTVVHWLPPTNEAVPDWIEPVQVVPSGAFVAPVPLLTFTWQVRTWLVPTWFTAVGGVSWMF